MGLHLIRRRRASGEAEEAQEEVAAPRDIASMSFSSSAPEQEGCFQEVAGEEGERRGWISRRTAIAAGTMAGAAVLISIFSLGFSSETAASEDIEQVAQLRSRARAAEARTEALPGAAEVRRQLAMATEAAEQVAGLQNDYRVLTHDAAQGGIDPALAAPMRLALRGHFASGTDEALLGPWYLLASDADAPRGTGMSADFTSGVAWEAPAATTITRDAMIPLLWVAREQSTGQVLAWVRADYDTVSSVIGNTRMGTTELGESLRLREA